MIELDVGGRPRCLRRRSRCADDTSNINMITEFSDQSLDIRFAPPPIAHRQSAEIVKFALAGDDRSAGGRRICEGAEGTDFGAQPVEKIESRTKVHVALARALRLVSAAFVLAACAPEASLAQDLGPNVEMRVGQEITFPVSVADGHVTPGPARASRPGSAKPRDGEITVSVATQKGSPYAEITASEKTSAPIDFVATGLVGNIKIDEVRVCGRPDAPASAHIYSGSWRISLNRFSLGPDPDCP